MLRYALFILLFTSCTSSTQLISTPTTQEQHVKSTLFDELNQYESLIEETETKIPKVEEIKISTATQYALQIGSWFFVQYLTVSQKLAAWCTVLVNGSEDNDNE